MSKQPPTRTHCKRSRPLPYCNQNCRMPQHRKFIQHLCTTRPPPVNSVHVFIVYNFRYRNLDCRQPINSLLTLYRFGSITVDCSLSVNCDCMFRTGCVSGHLPPNSIPIYCMLQVDLFYLILTETRKGLFFSDIYR